MTDSTQFGDLVTNTLLRGLVEDTNVRWVMLSATGRFTYLKLGRRRGSDDSLSRELVAEIAACVPETGVLRWSEWIVRTFSGADGKVVLIERLPAAVVDRLPLNVLNHLKRQIRKDSNGVLMGQPGSSKGALLLWLAMQIPEESVLLVSENPPTELPGTQVTHVFPPSTESERRVFQRLVRLNATVFWDRVTGSNDLQSLFGYPGAKRRWFSLDASSVAAGLRMLLGVMSQGTDARVETILALTSSVIGRPEVLNLLINDEEERREEFKSSDSALEAVQAYSSHDMEELGITGRNHMSGLFATLPSHAEVDSPPSVEVKPAADAFEAPEPTGVEEHTATSESEAEDAEFPSSMDDMPDIPLPDISSGLESLSSPTAAGIRKKRNKKTTDFHNPLLDDNPSTVPIEDFLDEDPDSVQTGLLAQSDLADATSNIRSSGEIDLQGFLANKRGNLPEETRQHEYGDSPTSNADADLLQELLPALRTPPETVNLDDLRITRAEDIDIDEEYDDISDHTNRSDNFDPKLAFDEVSWIEEDESIDAFEGILTADDVKTSVASADLYVSAIASQSEDHTIERQVPMITSPKLNTLAYTEEDRTEEIELTPEKLSMIREMLDRKK